MLIILIYSQSVVRKIEAGKTDPHDHPVAEVKIADCGGEKVDVPFSVLKESTPDTD